MMDNYEAIQNMTEAQAAEILENMRVRIYGGRGNGKTVLHACYNKAMQIAISKLKSDGSMGAEWIQETVETEYGKFPKLLCSSCRNPRAQIPMNYCGNCGEKMKNPDATIKGETTYEK